MTINRFSHRRPYVERFSTSIVGGPNEFQNICMRANENQFLSFAYNSEIPKGQIKVVGGTGLVGGLPVQNPFLIYTRSHC